MLKIESTGKNLEQAISNGLAELKVSRDDVSITVIEKGGLFKKAKVEIVVNSDVEEAKLNRQKHIEELEKQMQFLSEQEFLNEQNQDDDDCESEDFDNSLPSKNKSVADHLADNGDTDIDSQSCNASEEKNEDNSLNGQIEAIKNVEEEQNYSDVANAVVSFIKSACSLQGIIVKVDVKENKDDISLDITGENAKEIIGFRGEGLNALQYLCNIIAGMVDKNCPRIYVNVDNYKEEREQTLIKLARRLAYKCAKTKESIKLEPMTAYERKIVHKALQNDAYVTTHSEGEEPRRCLVIELKPKDK